MTLVTPAQAEASVSLDPNSGPPSEVMIVSGSGFTPSKLTYVWFDSDGDSVRDTGEPYRFITTTTGGELPAGVTLIVPDVESGEYHVLADEFPSGGGIDASATFTVAGSSISLGPDSGPSGTEIAITGQGFDAHTSGWVWFDTNGDSVKDTGEPQVEVTTTVVGELPSGVELTVPSVSANTTYQVRADIPEGDSVEASAGFTGEASNATTSLMVTKYDPYGVVIGQTAKTYQEMMVELPIYGDGVTHYYFHGPTFDDSTFDLLWDPIEIVNIDSRDYGATMGTSVEDLCQLAGGAAQGDTIQIKAVDNFSKWFDYEDVYTPEPEQGEMVVCWYHADYGFPPDYDTGMRLVFMSDVLSPEGKHVFGNWDMHQTLAENRWHYYYDGAFWPSSSGLSVKWVNEINIFTPAYTITGDVFEDDGDPATGAAVSIENLTAGGGPWDAIMVDNHYTVNIPKVDVSAADMLRITANGSGGWTDHKLHECDIAAEGFTADVTLQSYILNYSPCYPYYQMDDPDYAGPAVMQSCIAHYIDSPDQAILYTQGIASNDPGHSGLGYVDPAGMQTTLNDYLHPEGHNYSVGSMEDVEDALHRICYWQYLGPSAVPAYEDYSNWMAIRGIRTSQPPTDYSAPYDYTVHGFWVNDPHPWGIGENSYKTATDFVDDYYMPVVDTSCPQWDGKYITVLEPPQHEVVITLLPSVSRFVSTVDLVQAERALSVDGDQGIVRMKQATDEKSLRVIQAAIDGVTDELIPYDADFAAVFKKTTAGEPLLVSASDEDYYLVPFNEAATAKPLPIARRLGSLGASGQSNLNRPMSLEPLKGSRTVVTTPQTTMNTLVVVIIDARDGSFKEASWVENPVKYLKVSETEALRLAFKALGTRPFAVREKAVMDIDATELQIERMEQVKPIKPEVSMELVSSGTNPYHPDWKVTIGNDVFFVDQEGNVSR